MARKQIRKKEVKELNEELGKEYHIEEIIDKKSKVELEKTDSGEYIIVENEIHFFKHENKWIPTLRFTLKKNILKKVTVDMGAVKFVTSGADIMRPGIKAVEKAEKEEAVVIIDEKNLKPLAIGQLSFSSLELLKMDSGKVVKNLHFAGDKLWNSQI
jgi:PUA-domain protein